MSIISRKTLREALKGKGECTTVRAGKRRQFQWKDTTVDESDPLGDTIELMKHSGNDVILNHICTEFGGVFVKNIDVVDSNKNILQDQSSIICEMSDVIKTLTDCCADGKLSTKEIETLKREVDEFNREVLGLIQAAEKGKYNS